MSRHVRGTIRIRRGYNWRHVQTKIPFNLLQVLITLTIVIHDLIGVGLLCVGWENFDEPLKIFFTCVCQASMRILGGGGDLYTVCIIDSMYIT